MAKGKSRNPELKVLRQDADTQGKKLERGQDPNIDHLRRRVADLSGQQLESAIANLDAWVTGRAISEKGAELIRPLLTERLKAVVGTSVSQDCVVRATESQPATSVTASTVAELAVTEVPSKPVVITQKCGSAPGVSVARKPSLVAPTGSEVAVVAVSKGQAAPPLQSKPTPRAPKRPTYSGVRGVSEGRR